MGAPFQFVMPETGSVMVKVTVNPDSLPEPRHYRDERGRFRRRATSDAIRVMVDDGAAPVWSVEHVADPPT